MQIVTRQLLKLLLALIEELVEIFFCGLRRIVELVDIYIPIHQL